MHQPGARGAPRSRTVPARSGGYGAGADAAPGSAAHAHLRPGRGN